MVSDGGEWFLPWHRPPSCTPTQGTHAMRGTGGLGVSDYSAQSIIDGPALLNMI